MGFIDVVEYGLEESNKPDRIVVVELPPGVGKTYTAVQKAVEIASRRRVVVYILPNHNAILAALSYALDKALEMKTKGAKIPYIVYYEGVEHFCPFYVDKQLIAREHWMGVLAHARRKGKLTEEEEGKLLAIGPKEVATSMGQRYICKNFCPLMSSFKMKYINGRILLPPDVYKKIKASTMTEIKKLDMVLRRLEAMGEVLVYDPDFDIVSNRPVCDKEYYIEDNKNRKRQMPVDHCFCIRMFFEKPLKGKRIPPVWSGALILAPAKALGYLASTLLRYYRVYKKKGMDYIKPPLFIIDEYDNIIYNTMNVHLASLNYIENVEMKAIAEVLIDERNRFYAGRKFNPEKLIASAYALAAAEVISEEVRKFFDTVERGDADRVTKARARWRVISLILEVAAHHYIVRVKDKDYYEFVNPFAPRVIRLSEITKLLERVEQRALKKLLDITQGDETIVSVAKKENPLYWLRKWAFFYSTFLDKGREFSRAYVGGITFVNGKSRYHIASVPLTPTRRSPPRSHVFIFFSGAMKLYTATKDVFADGLVPIIYRVGDTVYDYSASRNVNAAPLLVIRARRKTVKKNGGFRRTVVFRDEWARYGRAVVVTASVYDTTIPRLLKEANVLLMSATGLPWHLNIFTIRRRDPATGELVGLEATSNPIIFNTLRKAGFYIGAKKNPIYRPLTVSKRLSPIGLDPLSIYDYKNPEKYVGMTYRELRFHKNSGIDKKLVILRAGTATVGSYVNLIAIRYYNNSEGSVNIDSIPIRFPPANAPLEKKLEAARLFRVFMSYSSFYARMVYKAYRDSLFKDKKPAVLVLAQRKEIAYLLAYVMWERWRKIVKVQRCTEFVCDLIKGGPLSNFLPTRRTSFYKIIVPETAESPPMEIYITWFRSKMSRGVDLPPNVIPIVVLVAGTPLAAPTAFNELHHLIPQRHEQVKATSAVQLWAARVDMEMSFTGVSRIVHLPADTAAAINELVQAVGRATRRAWRLLVEEGKIVKVLVILPASMYHKLALYAPPYIKMALQDPKSNTLPTNNLGEKIRKLAQSMIKMMSGEEVLKMLKKIKTEEERIKRARLERMKRRRSQGRVGEGTT